MTTDYTRIPADEWTPEVIASYEAYQATLPAWQRSTVEHAISYATFRIEQLRNLALEAERNAAVDAYEAQFRDPRRIAEDLQAARDAAARLDRFAEGVA